MELKQDMKILVIDDMATMRKVVKNMLIQMGFKNIVESDDGEKAWPLIQSAYQTGDPFQFIISDWNMPGMSGLDLLKTLKASNEYKDIPFLMVTAEAEQSSVMTAVKAGVSNFVVKPFSGEVLKEKIVKILTK